MTLRIAIDQQDIAVLQREICGRFPTHMRVLFAVYCVLGVFCLGAFATGVLIANGSLRSDPNAPLGVKELLAVAGLLFMAVGCGVAGWKARDAHQAYVDARLKEFVKSGLTIGPFELNFTEQSLIVRNARAIRKVAWYGLDEIEETKSNIVFWRRGDVFAFIPLCTVKDAALFDRLMRIHGPALKNKLAVKEQNGVNPHRVLFERQADDMVEFKVQQNRIRHPKAAHLMTLASSPAWPAIAFAAFLIFGLSCLYNAAATLNITSATTGVMALCAADVIFRRSTDAFRRPEQRFVRDGYWPYRQSEVTTVLLFEDGVSVNRTGADEIFSWSAFETLLSCRMTIYLVLSPQNVIAIPKRAFIDSVHYKAFVNFARNRIEKSKQEATKTIGARIKKSVGTLPKVTPSAPQRPPERKQTKISPKKSAPPKATTLPGQAAKRTAVL